MSARGLAAGLVLLASFGAGAQSRGVDIQLFRPVPTPLGLFTVDSARLLPPGTPSFGLFYNYQRDPLVLVSGEQIVERIVSDMQTANLTFGIGVLSFLQVGADLPVHVRMDGTGVETSGVGDVRVDVKWRLFGRGLRGFGLAIATPFTLPLGREDRFRGEGTTFAPRIVADYLFDRVSLVAHAGYLLRRAVQLPTLTLDDEIFYGAGVGVALWREPDGAGVRDRLTAAVELVGRTSAVTPFRHEGQNPLEALAGLTFTFPSANLALSVGGGGGLQAGYGAPRARAFLGLRFTPSAPPAPPRPPEPVAVAQPCPACPPPPTPPPPACPPAPPPPACPAPPAPPPPACPAAAPCPEPAPCPPAPSPEPVVVRLRHIHFRLNKTTPRTISHPALDRLVALLRKYPSLTIRVEGHTDNLGKPEYNQWLSEERARSVRAYLLSKGIEANRVVAVGRGATHPIASNKTKVGRRQNRRVEVHFTSPLPADVRIELRKTDL